MAFKAVREVMGIRPQIALLIICLEAFKILANLRELEGWR